MRKAATAGVVKWGSNKRVDCKTQIYLYDLLPIKKSKDIIPVQNLFLFNQNLKRAKCLKRPAAPFPLYLSNQPLNHQVS